MPSKMVTDRQKLTGSLRQAALTHAEEVSTRLTDILTPLLEEGETLPDLAVLQQLPARWLARREQTLVAADEAHLAELVDDRDPRRRRDELADEVRGKLVLIRGTVAALFGFDVATDVLGIGGATAADPVALHRQAARALERLSAPEPDLPPLQVEGIQLDPAALAASLQPAVNELAAVLDQVARERREAETTLAAKSEALATYDDAASRVVQFLSGLYELAERPEFAERLRLTQRHGGTSEPVPAQEEGSEATGPQEPAPPSDTSPGVPDELPGAP
jgi:hypothetical protein